MTDRRTSGILSGVQGRIGRADWLTLLVAIGWIVAEDLSWDPPASTGLTLATGVAAVAPLLFARHRPVLVGLAVTGGMVLRCALDAQAYENAMPYAASLVLAFHAALGARDRRAAVLRGLGATLPFLLADLTVAPLREWNDPSNTIFTAGFLACCGGVGWAIRSRWVETLALRRDRAALERTRAAELRSATAEERARIAHELHGIVSAATARTRVSAAAASSALDAGDTEAAERYLAETQQTTHATVDDLRRLLRVLRDDPVGAAGAPGAAAGPAGERRAWRWSVRLAPVAAFAILGAIDLARDVFDGPSAVALALAVLPAVPFAWRQRWPLAMSLLALALFDLRVVTGMTTVVTFSAWSLTAMAGWTCARHLAGRRALAGVAVAFGQLEAMLSIDPVVTLSDYIFVTLWAAIATVAGYVVRRRVLEAERVRREHDEALEARSREIEATLAAERRAIARDMHDVVGHALTILAIHAGAARRWVPRDVDTARGHVDVVRSASEDAAVELHRLLATIDGALGGDDARAPDAADLVALVRRDEVTATLDLDPGRIPASIGLAAYRIVQEALTNARKHAPGARVSVTAYDGGGRLRLEVRNGAARGRAPGLGRGGHGLVGMAERVRLFGGSLDAGPDGAGGWRVAAELPLGHVPAPAIPVPEAAAA